MTDHFLCFIPTPIAIPEVYQARVQRSSLPGQPLRSQKSKD